ncbi:transposase [Micromonospora luteifusca]|uniref:transposase n=1 Tax=Micromonospora luteifusca TaxID=709860 RepID=UPI00195953DB
MSHVDPWQTVKASALVDTVSFARLPAQAGPGEAGQHPHGRVGGCATSSPTSSVTTHRANTLWSISYSVGSVSAAPLSVVRQYIEQQNRPV